MDHVSLRDEEAARHTIIHAGTASSGSGSFSGGKQILTLFRQGLCNRMVALC